MNAAFLVLAATACQRETADQAPRSAESPDIQHVPATLEDTALLQLEYGGLGAARSSFERSLAGTLAGDVRGRVTALWGLGRIASAERDYRAAGERLREALALADSARLARLRIGVRASLAWASAGIRDWRAAQRWADAALALADSGDDAAARLEALEARGVALEVSRARGVAEAHLAAVDFLESRRGALSPGDARPAEHSRRIYEGAIRTLLQQGRALDAFVVAERARAHLHRQPVGGRDSLTSPVAAAPLAEVSSLLQGRGTTLLAYFWGERDVYGWAVTPLGIRGVRLGSADTLAAFSQFFRSALETAGDSVDWRAAARRAHARFVQPLAWRVGEDVLVVSDGPLSLVPFEAFLDSQGNGWAATRRIIYAPSVAVLVARATRDTTLPWTGAIVSVSARARLPALDTARYRIIHFAAPATVSDRRPEQTRLGFADGAVDLAGIRSLPLRGQLVALPASETPIAGRDRGEGLVALSHAFIAAGARALLVSLWRADDHVTATFMEEFYRELQGGRGPAEALRIVRSRHAADNPAYWAPFILVGLLDK